jgi:hypothetical protein
MRYPKTIEYANLSLTVNGEKRGFYLSYKQCHLKRWEYIFSTNSKGQPISEHSIPFGILTRVANDGGAVKFYTSGNSYQIKRESV